MDIQVDKTHYDFQQYVDLPRWNSYYYQINETLECTGKKVLYIGIGDNIVVDILKKFGKDVKTFDIDPALKPDYVGSITELPKILKNSNFDIIICAEVLEHIPFEYFENIILDLSKYTKERLILSLPNHNHNLKIMFYKFQKIFHIKHLLDQKWNIDNQGKGEHYWEIDARGCPTRNNIKNIVKKYYNLTKFYIPFNNTYHTFFILDNKL